MPIVLLVIGFLTTPAHPSGTSLSEYWAWVRYLHAISDQQRLILRPEYSRIDPHQKSILSDDFGMGVPIYWLAHKFNFNAICDGRFFIETVNRSARLRTTTKKVGPAKSPDFVALDGHGRWRTIECKGTQSSLASRDRQLGELGPLATSAISQKKMISFPNNYRGQRLACALRIAGRINDRSSLKIIDPDGDEFRIEEDQMQWATEAIVRGCAVRCLRLAGFEASARATSVPPDTVTSELRQRAEEELRNRSIRTRFSQGCHLFLGREVTFEPRAAQR